MEVVVIGGGLAGLVASRRLADAGHTVTLYEQHDTVGGRVRSIQRDGYIFDRGFQVLFTAYPAARRELDYEALNLQRFKPGAVICRPGSRSVISDPIRDPGASVETALSGELTIGDKLRVMLLRAQLTHRDIGDIFTSPDESIVSYLRGYGFSSRFIEHFAKPFFGGITLDRSLKTSKRVFEFVFKMLSEGAAAVPAQGMGQIPAQLEHRARNAGVTIETNTTVTAVTGHDTSASLAVEDTTREVDAIIVATDPSTSRNLTGITEIPTTARGCTTVYYRLPSNTLPFDRRILLNAEEVGPNEVVPISVAAPSYAPNDETVVSATFIGTPDTDDSELASQTRQTLAAWYPMSETPSLEQVHIDRISFAQFAQPPGIHDRLPNVTDPAGPVYLAGDITRGASINGALASGRDAAVAVDAESKS